MIMFVSITFMDICVEVESWPEIILLMFYCFVYPVIHFFICLFYFFFNCFHFCIHLFNNSFDKGTHNLQWRTQFFSQGTELKRNYNSYFFLLFLHKYICTGCDNKIKFKIKIKNTHTAKVKLLSCTLYFIELVNLVMLRDILINFFMTEALII